MDLIKYPLDDEMITYLENSEGCYPDDNGTLSIADNRRLYLKMCAAFHSPYPAGITSTDHELPGRHGPIPIRIYEHPQHRSPVTVMYLHGGGFVVGNLESHDSVCAEISEQSGYRVVSVDYRLAPEHTHPVQFEDALDVFLALDAGHTVVAGDSAGATLAASLCIAQHGSDRQPLGQVLIYPHLGGELLELDSYTSKADAPALSLQSVIDYRNHRSAGNPDWHDPIYYPLALKEYSDLPPCIAFAAEHDPVRDDAVEYTGRLKQAGVEATCYVEPGLVHGYLRARHCSEKAGASFARICKSIKLLGEL